MHRHSYFSSVQFDSATSWKQVLEQRSNTHFGPSSGMHRKRKCALVVVAVRLNVACVVLSSTASTHSDLSPTTARSHTVDVCVAMLRARYRASTLLTATLWRTSPGLCRCLVLARTEWLRPNVYHRAMSGLREAHWWILHNYGLFG